MQKVAIICVILAMIFCVSCEKKGESAKNTDEWGLTFSALDTSSTGMKLKVERVGEGLTGDLIANDSFSIEKSIDGNWVQCELIVENPILTDVGIEILQNGKYVWEVDWEEIYGGLEQGSYRIVKEVIQDVKEGEDNKKVYYTEFEIE